MILRVASCELILVSCIIKHQFAFIPLSSTKVAKANSLRVHHQNIFVVSHCAHRHSLCSSSRHKVKKLTNQKAVVKKAQLQNPSALVTSLHPFLPRLIEWTDLECAVRALDNLMPGPLDYNRGLKTTRLVPGGSLYLCQHTMMHVDEVNHLFSHLDLSRSGCIVETKE